jgi:hypothetical protein
LDSEKGGKRKLRKKIKNYGKRKSSIKEEEDINEEKGEIILENNNGNKILKENAQYTHLDSQRIHEFQSINTNPSYALTNYASPKDISSQQLESLQFPPFH